MAISLVAGGTGTGSAVTGLDALLTFPTLAQNDVVYINAARNNNVPSMTSAGWTSLASDGGGSTKINGAVFRKVMGLVPDASALVAGDGGSSSLACDFICLRGVDTTTPEDAVTTHTTGSSTNPDCPSITTVNANSWVLACAAGTNDAAITVPAGYSNHTTATDAAPSVTAALCSKLIAVAGAENPASWTSWTTGRWAGITVAVRASTTTTVALTGQSVTTSAGSFTVSNAVGMTGNSIAAASGALSATFSKPLAGYQVSTATGILGVIGGNVNAALVGLQVSALQGSLAVSLSRGLTGQSVLFAQGSLSAALSKTPTGLQLAAAQGALSKSNSAALVGKQVSGQTGAFGVSRANALAGYNVVVGKGDLTGVTTPYNDPTRMFFMFG